MTVASLQVAVSTTPTLVSGVIRLKNASSGTTVVYIGGSEVSSTTGYPLAVGAEVLFQGPEGYDTYGVYAVVASGTGTIATLSA